MRNLAFAAALLCAFAAQATVTGNPPPISYTCTGGTVYVIPFPYLAASHVVATQTTAAGVATVVVGTVKPSVAPTTGTLTLGTACPSGSTLTISRSVPFTQPQPFRTGSYQGAAHEQAFDRLEMQAQQLNAKEIADLGVVNNTVAAFNASGAAIGSTTSVLSTGSTTPQTLAARFAVIASVNDFNAKGDGVTDDTAAIQLAINTGRTVACTTGSTYIVGTTATLTQSTAYQVIDFSGCTLKLANTAAVKGILRLNGIGARVSGGTWDMNSANNLSDTDAGYSTWAVMLAADHTVAEKMYIHDSYGLAIKGLAGINHAVARFNRIVNASVIAGGVPAIYFDAPVGDVFGNRVNNNYIDVSGNVAASAIGVYSATPSSVFTVGQRRCFVEENEILGAAASATGVGITVRGVDCIVSGNISRGFTIGISVDVSQESRTLVSKNQVTGANGTTAYGIEVNGGRSTIQGNYVEGGAYGIIGSGNAGTGATMDALNVIGNIVKNQSASGIKFLPATGTTGQHMTIEGNTVTNSTASGVSGIALSRDCRYSKITGNNLDGPGAAVANSSGVYLDNVNSDIEISANKFTNWERAATVFNSAAVAQDRISFVVNDVSVGLGSNNGANLIALTGAATWGVGTRVHGNTTGSAASVIDDYLDRGTGVRIVADTTFSTPEANVTAAVGSLYMQMAGSGNLWVKNSGTGNTGWRSTVPTKGTITLAAGTGTATVPSAATCVCTDATANVSVKCAVAATTLTATGTGTDVISFACF